jgi:hypothetical protein
LKSVYLSYYQANFKTPWDRCDPNRISREAITVTLRQAIEQCREFTALRKDEQDVDVILQQVNILEQFLKSRERASVEAPATKQQARKSNS